MSRIQNILEKAERDGAVRRMHPLAEPAGATLARDMPPVAVPPPATIAGGGETHAPSAVTAAPAVRTVRPQLDRIVMAAFAPDAFAAEQYRALRTRMTQSAHVARVDVILITSPGRGEGKSL